MLAVPTVALALALLCPHATTALVSHSPARLVTRRAATRVVASPPQSRRRARSSLTVTMKIGPTNDVKTVSETNRAFDEAYPRPIVTVWRSPINEMLQVTHLSVVDGRFAYDPIFAYGYMYVFETVLDKYPVEGEKDKLIDATIVALDMKPATIRADAAAVAKWLDGKSEADILEAPAKPSDSKINKALADIKASENYLHTRAANVGILNMMDVVGVKANSENLAKWTDAFGMRKRNLEKDSVLLKDIREKLVFALQMIKSLEIREKKRMANQLEKKAKEAQAAADAKAAEAEASPPAAEPLDASSSS